MVLRRRPSVKNPPESRRPGKNPCPPDFMERLIERFFLLDAAKHQLIGPTDQAGEMDLTPLTSRGQLVGYLGYVPITRITNDRHLHFLKEQRLAYIMVAGIIVLLSGLLSLLLARRLVRPLGQPGQGHAHPDRWGFFLPGAGYHDG